MLYVCVPKLELGNEGKQKGICVKCKEHFELSQMEADHITPWHDGGKTNSENCQMLCRECNRRKSGK
ncbi:HNH endonuclease signature motif containing protein [Sulfurimonas sp.]|uniref:HNH endonuclease n=1 Tax=Sulfurimonas sp. TaxID=2022749 RepID=UPI003455BEE4